jgi:ammonium transporter, Amt family
LKRFVLALAAVAVLVAVQSVARADTPPVATTAQEQKLDSGDTAWMLTSTGLVLLMVPGLALFYGGMVRRKNVLGTMMHSMVALAIIGIEWVLFGYAFAFGKSQGGFIGWDWDFVALHNVLPSRTFPGTNIPIFVHCMYQGMFAIITPALISGAVAERVKFGPYCLFIFLWGALVYVPLAHWVWAVNFTKEADPAGWLGNMGQVIPAFKGMGALDFAGGTVVHIAAGLSGLAAILVLRKRIGYPEHAIHPNSMVLTLTGAGLLWFGWFGFNGGSALHSNGQAGSALTASQVAAAAAALSWMVVEWLHRGKPTALGFASGVVAGLVAITPASGFVSPVSALVIGALAGVICYGAVLTGVFASAVLVKNGGGSLPDNSGGLIADQKAMQVVVQLIAALVAVVYSFVFTVVLVKGIDMVFGFALSPKAEGEGLDRHEHGEVGFDLGLALESIPEKPQQEPRPASAPRNGQRHFTVEVVGPSKADLLHAWSELCQAGPTPPPEEFRAVYPYVTTVQGNRFNFRGGDATKLAEAMKRLFQARLGGSAVHTRVESAE